MITEPHFNLVDECWIPVLSRDGEVRDVSLLDVFRQADRLVAIACELPTLSVAVLRLLLAVLHRSVEGPAEITDWVAIRDDWAGDVENVEGYLDDHRDRFWMQHPTSPFLQVPDLRTARGEEFGLSRIVCDGPGTSALMTTRLGEHLETATWAQAALWLVHVHAFDVSGIHTGAVGDPRVKGGRGYAIGTGWAGQLGILHLLGESLQETLLLNLLAPEAAGLETRGVPDLPVWERAPLTALPEGWHPDDGPVQPYRQPTGPVDLYTWPTRRVRLSGDADHARGVINAQGDRATPHNRQTVEPMSAWRYSEPQTKTRGQDTYMPLKHRPERALWRGLEALLPQASHAGRPGEPARRRAPALATWLARLEGKGLLDERLVRWQAVGIEYGSNESVFAEVLADQVTLPAALFSDADLAREAADAVDVAERAVSALGRLAQNVALAAGASPESEGPRQSAQAAAYAELDPRFRQWVVGLGGAQAGDVREQQAKWQATVRDLLLQRGDDVVDGAGPAALKGRISGGQFRDAGLALHWFRKKLREVLPAAFPDTAATPSSTGGEADEREGHD